MASSNINNNMQKQSVLDKAEDFPSFNNFLRESDKLLPIFKQLCESKVISTKRKVAGTLSKESNGKNSAELVKWLPILSRLLESTDVEILRDSCNAVGHIANGLVNQVQAVFNSKICSRLVELLIHSDCKVQSKALYAVGNITAGNHKQTQILLNHGPLPGLVQLIYSTHLDTKKEACRTIANITAGNEKQIQEIISANVVPKLIDALETENYEIRLEIAWAISNLTTEGSSTQIHYIVMIGCLPTLCDFLTYNDLDVVKRSLTSIEVILKTGKLFKVHPNPYAVIIDNCGGRDKIIYLQTHEDEWFYTACFRIIEQYFNYDYMDLEYTI